MTNSTENSTLSEDAAQIAELEKAARSAGADSDGYRQQLSDRLEAITAQLGAEGNNSASQSGGGGFSGDGSAATSSTSRNAAADTRGHRRTLKSKT